MLDEILNKYRVKYDNLSPEERTTFNTWATALQEGQLTLEKVREYIQMLRYTVEEELIKEPEFNYIFIFKVPNRKQILLKARLQNYMLMEIMLSSPEKMRQRIERQIAAIGNPAG